MFRIYGMHAGRAEDSCFGALPTRALAEAEIAKLLVREMHDQNWAARYHDGGFVIREQVVETDFEIPSLPKPRDRFVIETTNKPNGYGIMDSLVVDVYRRGQDERIARYERNLTGVAFEPFRQGTRELALISRDYEKTAVLDLATDEVIAEENNEQMGFCPVGFYVPDWWDVNDGSVIPGNEYWSSSTEWPVGDFGFVWGCVWGDDSAWKIQYLDLSRVREGVILREERFGHVELADIGWSSPCLGARSEAASTSKPPPFIALRSFGGKPRVRLAVEIDFDLVGGEMTSPVPGAE
ncbi:MAG: hypothetical protein ABI551_25390 [Polyangiaceae bacterium]